MSFLALYASSRSFELETRQTLKHHKSHQNSADENICLFLFGWDKSVIFVLFLFQYGRSDSYRVATTQDKDEKESPKKKGGKDLDDLKKEVPIVSTRLPTFCDRIFETDESH